MPDALNMSNSTPKSLTTLSSFPVEVWSSIALHLAFEDLLSLIMTGSQSVAYNVSRSTSVFELTTNERNFGHPSRHLPELASSLKLRASR